MILTKEQQEKSQITILIHKLAIGHILNLHWNKRITLSWAQEHLLMRGLDDEEMSTLEFFLLEMIIDKYSMNNFGGYEYDE